MLSQVGRSLLTESSQAYTATTERLTVDEAVLLAEMGDPKPLFASADRALALHAADPAAAEEHLAALSRVLETAGYGQDADLLHGVMVYRRFVLAALIVPLAPLPTHVDRALKQWAEWGAHHQLRSLALAVMSAAGFSNDGLELARALRDLVGESDGVERRT